MTNIKVSILSDSLSLPRMSPEAVNYEQCYPYLLGEALDFKIMHNGIGGSTAESIVNQFHYLKGQFDLYIFQFGIVDCVPRALRPFERVILRKLPFELSLSDDILRFLRKNRNLCNTTEADFEKYLQIIRNGTNGKSLFIGMPTATSEYEQIVPGIGKAIGNYNSIISKVFNDDYISLSSVDRSHLLSDNVHLNPDGHALVAELLLRHPRIIGIQENTLKAKQ